MRKVAFLSTLAAALAAFTAAATLDNGQIRMDGESGRWAAARKQQQSQQQAQVTSRAADYFETENDPFVATSGFGGPSRIELPLDAISSAAFGSANVEDIIASQKGDFTVLSHREFPSVSVRIKQLHSPSNSAFKRDGNHDSDPEAFCDPTVTSWSGYIDTAYGTKSLWFYFFESRSDPAKDPVILWTNGGPGCSSSMGLFMELGPCRIPENGGKLSPGPPINGTVWHPQSWTNRANVFFIDQPVGVGFSYSKTDQMVYTTEEAAKDVYAFLRVFFSAFDRFKKNDFYMAGESYGGRYIPIFASEVADRNHAIVRKADLADKKPNKDELINLKGVLIGNGLTDVAKQTAGYYDMTCTKKAGVEPILSIETCKSMYLYVPKCQKALQEYCVDTFTPELCENWSDICSSRLQAPYMTTGQNPYNIKDNCKAGIEPNLCYSVTQDIRSYLDRDDVRSLLGAASVDQIGKFQSCNMKINQGFSMALDSVHDNAFNVAGLLERNIRTLVYIGDLDWICNALGNKQWVDSLDFSGAEEFRKAKIYEWIVDGKEAGETRSGGGLTWATVYEAGHMVPYDQPDAALAMLNRWLDGQDL